MTPADHLHQRLTQVLLGSTTALANHMLMANAAKGAAEVGGTDGRLEGHPRNIPGAEGLSACRLRGGHVSPPYHVPICVPGTFASTQTPNCAWDPGGMAPQRTVDLLCYKTAFAKVGRAQGTIYLF